MRVAGVDGFKAGWVVAHLELQGQKRLRTRIEVAEHFKDVYERTKACEAVAVDIPIGLSNDAPRACDTAARALLGKRSSSVFPAPLRCVLVETSHAAANRLSKRRARIGTPAQTFALVPKILEVDEIITPRLQERVFEVHPELSFRALNEGRSLEFSKRSAIGVLQRLRLLLRVGIDVQTVLGELERSARPGLEGKVGLDDVLDALAAAWSAQRKVQGLAEQATEEVQFDSEGLRMQITW